MKKKTTKKKTSFQSTKASEAISGMLDEGNAPKTTAKKGVDLKQIAVTLAKRKTEATKEEDNE